MRFLLLLLVFNQRCPLVKVVNDRKQRLILFPFSYSVLKQPSDLEMSDLLLVVRNQRIGGLLNAIVQFLSDAATLSSQHLAFLGLGQLMV